MTDTQWLAAYFGGKIPAGLSVVFENATGAVLRHDAHYNQRIARQGFRTQVLEKRVARVFSIDKRLTVDVDTDEREFVAGLDDPRLEEAAKQLKDFIDRRDRRG